MVMFIATPTNGSFRPSPVCAAAVAAGVGLAEAAGLPEAVGLGLAAGSSYVTA